MNDSSSGLLRIGSLLGVVVILMVAQHFVPSLASALLFMAVAAMILVVLLVLVVMYFAFKKPKKNEQQTVLDEVRSKVQSGKKELMALRRMSMEVKNSEIRKLSTDICVVIDKIFRNLNENPDALDSLSSFFNYYLPAIRKILEGYAKLEANTVPSEEVKNHVIVCLSDIKTAMENKRDNMFDDEILDLTVEMEVFTQMCKRDGLLPDHNPKAVIRE